MKPRTPRSAGQWTHLVRWLLREFWFSMQYILSALPPGTFPGRSCRVLLPLMSWYCTICPTASYGPRGYLATLPLPPQQVLALPPREFLLQQDTLCRGYCLLVHAAVSVYEGTQLLISEQLCS